MSTTTPIPTDKHDRLMATYALNEGDGTLEPRTVIEAPLTSYELKALSHLLDVVNALGSTPLGIAFDIDADMGEAAAMAINRLTATELAVVAPDALFDAFVALPSTSEAAQTPEGEAAIAAFDAAVAAWDAAREEA